MLTKVISTSIIATIFLIGCGAEEEQNLQTISMPHQVDIAPKNSRELDPQGPEYQNYMKTHNLNSVIFNLKDGTTKLNDFDHRDENLNYVFYYDSDHNKETGYYDKWVSKSGSDYLYENDILYRYTGTPGSHEWSWEVVDFGTPENHPNHFHGLENALAYGISLNPDWSQHSFLGYFDTTINYIEKKYHFVEATDKISTSSEDGDSIYLHTYDKNYQKRDTNERYYNYNFTINNTNYSTQGNILLNEAGEILSDNLLYETREYDTITIIPKRLLNQGTVKLKSLQTRADNWNLLSSLTVGNVGVQVTREQLLEMINNGEDVTQVDVSGITDMSRLFYLKTHFNQDISGWDVSHVTNMSNMFTHAESFNQAIGNWDVSSVTNMSGMFGRAYKFNQNIGNWDVSHVTKMSSMFRLASDFNQDIGNWDVSHVTTMSGLFDHARAFNQDISRWDVSSVTNMNSLFYTTDAFNQNISNWDVSSVTDMAYMFNYATAFNQNITTWNVQNVVDYEYFNDESALQEQNIPALFR